MPAADQALERLETVKTIARTLPIHNPAPGKAVSSSYGVRKDPFSPAPVKKAKVEPTGGRCAGRSP